MLYLLLGALLANALAHVYSYRQLSKEQSENALGVLVFAFVNASLAGLLWFQIEWAHWPTLILPLLGATGLSITTLIPGKGGVVDYIILLLDILIIGLTWFLFF